MEGLNKFEQAVLDKAIAGDHPLLAVLRVQAEMARLVEREQTGVGFFCMFDVDACAPTVDGDFEIADVYGELNGGAIDVGFVLFIRSGRLSMLEGFTFDGPWPECVADFQLGYDQQPRKIPAPRVPKSVK